jgi:DNA-binding MarR family transcriptional regulator
MTALMSPTWLRAWGKLPSSGIACGAKLLSHANDLGLLAEEPLEQCHGSVGLVGEGEVVDQPEAADHEAGLTTREVVAQPRLERVVCSVDTECMVDKDRTEQKSPAMAAELQYVEEVALGFERQGLFRMAGRVLGWLLICDPPEQTFGQLAEVLQASKGSISAAMKFLVPAGLVERISRPGDRRDYYRCRPGAWAELARDQSRLYGDFRKLAQRGLELLADAPADRRERLQDMQDFYGWLEREMPALWARWRREQQEQEPRGGTGDG